MLRSHRSRWGDDCRSTHLVHNEAPVGAGDSPEPGSFPQRLAKIIRSQWVIENRPHFVRDTAFREDASKVHTEHGPENMATLRSFAINCLRAAGHHNIAAGLREMSYEPFTRPLALLGLR
ncbi:hypothetical protein AB5L52_18725 [Streptomyces sp. CG4]|uniref:hypothetical protein n=1 Tax=Streptomyces sp. CG4 TaxID=408783 RepID=UPI0034E262C9